MERHKNMLHITINDLTTQREEQSELHRCPASQLLLMASRFQSKTVTQLIQLGRLLVQNLPEGSSYLPYILRMLSSKFLNPFFEAIEALFYIWNDELNIDEEPLKRALENLKCH
jgi:hypothetical protein